MRVMRADDELPGYEVRWLQATFLDLRYLFPAQDSADPSDWASARRPRFLVERHARKLAWWREDSPFVLGDLPWQWVPALRAERVAEVLIEEDFGSIPAIRHLFRVAENGDGKATTPPGTIWGLGAWRYTGGAVPAWMVEVAGLRLFSITERDL